MNEKVEGLHPVRVGVPVCNGTRRVHVAPWTMAQRRELKPRVAAVVQRVMELNASPGQVDLAALFTHAEDELHEVARASVQLPDDLAWDDLLWEDLPTIVQAIWETSIDRGDGGGMAGKLGGVAASLLNLAARHLNLGSSTDSRPPDSPSSPGGGAATQRS